jgi:hypothetical protein
VLRSAESRHCAADARAPARQLSRCVFRAVESASESAIGQDYDWSGEENPAVIALGKGIMYALSLGIGSGGLVFSWAFIGAVITGRMN